MRDARGWLIELMTIAPRVDGLYLDTLAEFLAAGDKVPVDMLLVMMDRLTARAIVADIEGRLRDVIELHAVRSIIEREAERPRPGFY